jgi:hypothetical protein
MYVLLLGLHDAQNVPADITALWLLLQMFYSSRCLILSVTTAFLPEPLPGNASLVYILAAADCSAG